MTSYIVRRLVLLIPVYLGMTFLVYLGVNAAPGDPLMSIVPYDQLQHTTPEELAELRRALGLDQPLGVRYLNWLGRAMRGDLGYSYTRRADVARLIRPRITNTLKLSLASIAIALAIGLTAGVLASLNHNTWIDYVLSVVTLAQWSTPPFFVALVAIYLFAVNLGWLPAFGTYSARDAVGIWDQIRHMIMPAGILGLYNSATYSRYTRSSMLETLRAEFVTVARAKGLRDYVVTVRHVFRNAMLPIVTILGLSLANVLSGAVIIETMFGWPGMGKLAVDATLARDYPLLMACVLLSGVTILVGNLLVDIAYASVDPRIVYD